MLQCGQTARMSRTVVHKNSRVLPPREYCLPPECGGQQGADTALTLAALTAAMAACRSAILLLSEPARWEGVQGWATHVGPTISRWSS